MSYLKIKSYPEVARYLLSMFKRTNVVREAEIGIRRHYQNQVTVTGRSDELTESELKCNYVIDENELIRIFVKGLMTEISAMSCNKFL